MNRREFLSAFSATASALVLPIANAQSKSLQPTVEGFFRYDIYRGVTLSPDRKSLAAIIPIAGRQNIAIVDLESGKATPLTAINDRDVRVVRWINNERLMYDLIDRQSGLGEQRPAGLFAINKDGSEFKEIASPNFHGTNFINVIYRGTRFLRTIPGSSDILAISNDRHAESYDVYRIDSKTGRRTLLTFNRPDRTFKWFVDEDRVPRIAMSAIDHTTRIAIYHRFREQQDMTKMIEFDGLANEGFVPLRFDHDGTLYVSSRNGSDRAAIYTYDLKANRLGGRLIAHKDNDFDSEDDGPQVNAGFSGHLVLDDAKKKLVGIRQFGEREETYWLDEDWARLQASLDAALPRRVNRILDYSSSSRSLILSYSDREPGTWYLYDGEKKTLTEAVARRPWIRAELQGERRFLLYRARDGLQIPAFLTLPPGRAEKNLSLVLIVHGGPFVRGEYWEWVAQAQFLASRGYAVLQPDYRGSRGYGWNHYVAGRRQWGLAMQDDLTDGVKALVTQGIVDATRVAIMGGSYGGYATMMGLAKDPELYRCGINIVGVTDLELMADATWSDMGVWRPEFQAWFASHVGDPKTEKEKLRAASPYLLADRIKRPVLMVHGGYDRRVPIDHATRMRSALEAAKVPYEWVVYNDEAHGLMQESSRIDLYGRVERFLAKHMT